MGQKQNGRDGFRDGDVEKQGGMGAEWNVYIFVQYAHQVKRKRGKGSTVFYFLIKGYRKIYSGDKYIIVQCVSLVYLSFLHVIVYTKKNDDVSHSFYIMSNYWLQLSRENG